MAERLLVLFMKKCCFILNSLLDAMCMGSGNMSTCEQCSIFLCAGEDLSLRGVTQRQLKVGGFESY